MQGGRWLLVLALGFLCGCNSDVGGAASSPDFTAVAAANSASAAGAPDYRLVTGDLLDISVFQVPDLTREVQIDGSGNISLPLIGELRAAGLTARVLQDEIAAKLRAKYLRSPQVDVFLKDSVGSRVTVDGAVKSPGVYSMSGQTTLMQILARSGGLSDVADSKAILVFRSVNGQKMAAKFNVNDIRAGKVADPSMLPGDMVIADTSGPLSAWQSVKQTLPSFAYFIPRP